MNNNIIRPCLYIAGVDSSGMRALQKDFGGLSEHKIEELDPLNANNGLPYYYKLKIRTSANGTYYENEKEPREYQRKTK